MVKSCSIIPTVKSKDGFTVESRLFKDLLSYTSNREETRRIYLITKSENFIQKWNPRLEMDENSEPTFRSLYDNTNLKTFVSDRQILEKLNRDMGVLPPPAKLKLHINTPENSKMLRQRAIDFNNKNPFSDRYVAQVVKVQDSESHRVFLSLKVEPRDKMNSLDSANMEYNENLNRMLKEILTAQGISIGALNDLEQRRGIAGVTDFSQAKDAANGIIELIRLADGIKGEKALPEEFAHFALEAMQDNPLVKRLVDYIVTNNLASEIIGDDYQVYEQEYQGDANKIAKEAAGKLLAKHLLRQEPIVNKPYSGLLSRVINAIKDFFKKLTASSIQRAKIDADAQMGQLAKSILQGSLNEEMKVSNIATSEKFYNTTERVERDKILLKKIIDTELKRLSIYEKRNPKSKVTQEQRALLDKLELDFYQNNHIEGIYNFLSDALDELKKINNQLISLKSTPGTNLNERAGQLREARNTIFSYKNVLKDIKDALLDEESASDNRYGTRVRIAIDNVLSLMNDLDSEYDKVAMPLFVDFIKPFVGEKIVVPFGKYKGKEMTANDLIKKAEHDISFFDRWLDSMADSSDTMNKIMDQAVKKAKNNARLRTVDLSKQIQAAGLKLEKSGVKDMEWMFERDSKGKTGYYISEYNWGLFKEARKKMVEGLIAKYGNNPTGDDAKRYEADRKQWFEQNSTKIGGKIIPIDKYKNKDFANLSPAKREFYDTIMNIKGELDKLLPDNYTTENQAIQIRKDLIERVKSSSSIKAGGKELWENIKDQFIERADDTDFGTKAVQADFEKHAVQKLPIYYTKALENSENVSTDVVSTMIAYASMVNDFDEMNDIINALEVGRDLLRKRSITQTIGNRKLIEKVEVLGRKTTNDLEESDSKTSVQARLDDFFEMQVYGRYMADEGTFGSTNISKGKSANFVNRVTSMNSLALNVLSGLSNVATGSIMMRIEGIAGEFFTTKDVIYADRIYGKELPVLLGEVGKRIKTSKLSLWVEYFDTLQEYDTDIKNTNFDRKTWFSKMFGTSTLFFLNNAGEHWMQTRTSLALASHTTLTDADGKKVNIWDAYSTRKIDPKNPGLGAEMILRKGLKTQDGKTIITKDELKERAQNASANGQKTLTMTDPTLVGDGEISEIDFIRKFSRKSAAINQRMHGIYNKADRNAVQRLALGRMAMMFRKWIKPSLNRRFKSATYNYDLEAWTEGFYLTTGNFLWTLIRDLKAAQFDLGARWNELTNTEKANIRRAAVEASHFLLLMLVLGLIDWDDDKDRPWAVKMAEYQARRLYTELGSMMPTPFIFNEAQKILKSPAAGINTIEDTLGLLTMLNPWAYSDTLERGRYKGHSRAYKAFYESPIAIMNKTIYRGLHPEEGIPFFKQ